MRSEVRTAIGFFGVFQVVFLVVALLQLRAVESKGSVVKGQESKSQAITQRQSAEPAAIRIAAIQELINLGQLKPEDCWIGDLLQLSDSDMSYEQSEAFRQKLREGLQSSQIELTALVENEKRPLIVRETAANLILEDPNTPIFMSIDKLMVVVEFFRELADPNEGNRSEPFNRAAKVYKQRLAKEPNEVILRLLRGGHRGSQWWIIGNIEAEAYIEQSDVSAREILELMEELPSYREVLRKGLKTRVDQLKKLATQKAK